MIEGAQYSNTNMTRGPPESLGVSAASVLD